jgi:DNA-binding transcriptional MerR regulator
LESNERYQSVGWACGASLAFECTHTPNVLRMDQNIALHEALRLAVDPPGGVSVEALRELARDDDATEWDIATTATHLNVSPHTLRYYERIGLVRIARDHAGHRSFDAASVRRLVFLTRMRTSGMSISDLRHYVDLIDAGEATVPERLDMLLEHRDTLRSQIAQLQLALAATEYKIATHKGAPQP